MFKFLMRRKFNKLIEQIIYFGEVGEDNWPEYKALHIESMLLACRIDTSSSRRRAYWQVLQLAKENRKVYMGTGMPSEFYADLLVTLKELAK